MSDYSKTEQEVLDTHNLFWQAYADRDLALRFSMVADEVTFIGTGLYEKAANKKEYRIINEKGVEQYPAALEIEFVWLRVSVLNDTAWVESEVIWKLMIDNKRNEDLLRNTVIFKKQEDKWLVVHVHGSNPDYRFGEGEFMMNENIIKRNRELEKEVYERTMQLNKSLQELKATQSQLIQSEKMASLGELTAGIAHEIQNPLNFVNNFSEVNTELIEELKTELATGNKQEAMEIADSIKDNEEKINHHGKRADAIVKGMLQHSRSSNGVKEPTDVNALCDEYLRLAYHGLRAKDKSFKATMKTDFDQSIGKINIIPQDIGRVILNLLTNAFYVVDEKMKAYQAEPAEAGKVYDPTVSISTKKISDKVEIRVTDNGSGIPKKVLEKIFQPFFTTKPTGQGTGLGLSLSYDIIKAQGGELKVETKEAEGTTFIINLPFS